MYVWLRSILLYIVAVARISLMNVIKVRMQSSYMCGIIMRRIYTAPRSSGFDYDPISMFSHVLYVYFFVLTYFFLFSHKTIPCSCPKHVDVSTINPNPHGRLELETDMECIYSNTYYTTVVVYTL